MHRLLFQLQFDSSEHQNGTSGKAAAAGALAANGRPESIEQDGPSEIFRDEEGDSKVG